MSVTKEQAFAAMTRQYASNANTFLAEYVTRRLFYHAKNGCQRAPYSNVAFHNLDTLLIPVQNMAHGFLFNIRTTSNILDMTMDGLWKTLNAAMLASARSVADIDLMQFPGNEQEPLMHWHLLHYQQQVEESIANVAAAQEQLRLAAERMATSTDVFMNYVNGRKKAIFKTAFFERIKKNKPFAGILPAECSLCLGALKPDNACWVVNGTCKHETVPFCAECMVNASFEAADEGKQTYSKCPYCRAEYTLEDVHMTGNA